MATPDLLKGEKRARNLKILKDVMLEETTSAENVMERENVKEKTKMHHKNEDKIVGDKIQSLQREGTFSTMKQPKISGDISVTDGSETQGFETKEKVILGHETKKNRGVVQDEPSEHKKFSFQQTVEETASEEIKGIKKDTQEHKETTVCIEKKSVQKPLTEPQQVILHGDIEKKQDICIQGVKDKPTFSFELSNVKHIKPLEKAKKLKQTDQEKKPVEAENVETNLKTQEIVFSELVKSLQEGSPNPSIVEFEEAEERSYATEGIQSKTEIMTKPEHAKHKTLPKKQARQETNSQSLQLRDSHSKENRLTETEEERMENVSQMSENKNKGIQLAMSKGIPKKEIPQDKADPLKKKTLEQIRQLPQDKNITDNEVIMKNEGRDSAADKLLHETIQSKVVTLKGKLVKVSPMEGTTEMKPKRNIVTPESEEETVTDNILQKPEIIPQSRTTRKGVSQNMRQQTVGEEQFVAAQRIQVSLNEKIKQRQERSERQTTMKPETEVPKQTLEQYASKAEDIVKVEEIPPTRPIQSKGMEQIIETKNLQLKVQPKMVTAEDKQHHLSPTKPPVPQTEKGEMLAKTEQIGGKGVKSQLLISKGKTSITEKGKKADLFEMSQADRVPLKDKEQKVGKSEDTQLELQSEVREVKTDKMISSEEQKTKIRNIFRKSPTGKKENSEAVTQKKAETQKQGQQRPVKGKAQDVQSKTIRIKDETAEVNSIKVKEATKQELIERMSSLTPVIELTHKESLMAGDSSEKCATISEVGQDIVEKEGLDLISSKIKPPPTEKRDMFSKVHLETGENKIPEIKKITEQAKRKGTYTAKPGSEELQSEQFTPERLKLSKPGETTGQSVDSKMITDKCTKITERLDRRDMQALSRSDKMISTVRSLEDMESFSNTEKLTTDEITSMTVTDRPAKIISSKASQKCIETDLREQEQPERKASVADLTEVTSEESLTEKVQMIAKPKEAVSVRTESESASPQEPQQKLTKPQEIIVEQDQLKVSTVKDKTFKVIPIKERKTTQKQIERQVSVTPMIEEISKEPEVSPEDMSEIKVTEFAAAEDIGVTVGILPKESMSLKVRQQTLGKTQEAEDQPTPLKLKVTPLEHGKPKTQELQIRREVSDAPDKGIPQSDPLKEEISKINTLHKRDEEFHKQLPFSLGVYAPKETGPIEVVSDDLSEHDYHKKDDAQKGKRRTSAKSKKISTEEARKVAVSDEYCNTAPSEATQIRQGQMKRITSMVPVVDKAAEKTPTTKNKDTKDILKQTITSSDGVNSFTFRKEREIKVEEIHSNLDPDNSKGDKVASIEKKTLKRQEQIDNTALGASESDVTYKQSLAKYDDAEKEEKTAKPVVLEEKKKKWEQTKAEVASQVKVKETKPDEFCQEKDVAQKLAKVYKIAAEVINEADETGKIPPSVAAKPSKQEQIAKRGLVTILHGKPFNEQTTEEIQFKTVTVKVEYGNVTPFEVTETKQERVKRMLSVPPVMDVASEKTQVAKDGEFITDTCRYITAKTKDIDKDKPEKTEAKTKVSRAVEHYLTHQNTLVEKSVTETEIQTETDTPIMKEAIKTEEGQKLDKTSPIIFEDVPTKIKSSEEKQSRLGKNTNISLKEVQSKTGTVKNEYGSVTRFEVTETKQEQIKNKFSVAPEMKVAFERYQIVKEGDDKSDTVKRHITPEELIKDTASRKEYVCEMDDTSLTKMDTEVIAVEDDKSKVDLAQDETEVSPIREELLERWKQTEGKASIASEAEEKFQHPLVEREASEKPSVMDKTAILLPPEEIKHRQKQTKEKTDVIPATWVIATENKDIQSKKSKFLNKKGRMLEKGTFSLEEVQSMVVTVKDEYCSVSPLKITETKQEQVERTISVPPVMTVASEKLLIVKDGDFKSDTLQRVIIPDKDVKDFTSRKEGVYESSEVPLISHLQSPLSAQDRLEILAEKYEITDKDTQAKEVTDHFKTNQTASVDMKQKQTQQKAQWAAVAHQNTPETLVGQDKTEAVGIDHSPGHDEVKYDCMSQKKSYSLKDQHQVTVEGIQSKTDTIRDVTPAVETKQEQTEQIEILKQSFGERDKSDVAAEEIQTKVVTVKDRTGTIGPLEGAKIRLEHTESKTAEDTCKQLLISGDRPEKYTKRDILKDKTETKEEIRTALSAKQETKDEKQWPKSKSAEDEAARVTPREATKVKPEQVERQPTVTSLFEAKPKESLLKEDDLGRQLKLAKVKKTEPEKLIGKDKVTKECHANEKTEIEDTGEQIKGEMLVTPMKRNEELYQFREITNEEMKISDKYIPKTLESKADIDVLPLYEPTVKEPSVTDKTKENITEKETTDYITDSAECREGATRKWKPEVEQSCLEADVQYMPPQEVEGAQGIQSIIETRVLSLEPERKTNASLQQSSRGI